MAYDPARGLINGANLVGGLLQQGRDTEEYVSGMFDQAARRKAGAAIARGDNQTAAGLLGERGDLKGAATLRQAASTQSSLQAIDAGNFDRAKEESAAAGDTGMYSAAEGAQDNDRKERAAWLGNAADALLQIKDPAQRHQGFQQHIAPTLKAMGMSDADIAKVDQQQLSDEGLQSFKASLGLVGKGEIRQDPNTGDLISIDPRTGAATVVYKAGQKKDWKEFKRADGSSYWKDMNAAGGGAETDVDPTAGGSAGGTPEVKGGAYDRIATIAGQAGASPQETTYLKRLAQVESGANASAKNGSSTGVFQFHPDTFASVGGTDINSVEDQTKAAIELARRDRGMLEKSGVPITDANLYIMHQQGAGGGRALLTAPPDVNAVEALTPVYGNAKTARKAIVGNGGTADMTAGEFVDYWRNRWAGGAKAATGTARNTGAIEGDAAPAKVRPITSEERKTWGIPDGVPAVIKPDGTPDVISLPAGQAAPRKAEADLRKEFNARPEVKEFREVDNAYRTIQRLSQQNTPAGDISMIFAYMKALDPTSVVREGEFATAQNAAGIPDRVTNLYNKALKGTRLNDRQRGDFTLQAKNLFETRKGRFDTIADEYRGYASDYDLNPDRIVTDRAEKSLPRLQGATDAQETARAQYQNSGAKVGANRNPYVPTTQGQFDKLPVGAWFLNPKDGKLLQKAK